jgi:hypothetical protein
MTDYIERAREMQYPHHGNDRDIGEYKNQAWPPSIAGRHHHHIGRRFGAAVRNCIVF